VFCDSNVFLFVGVDFNVFMLVCCRCNCCACYISSLKIKRWIIINQFNWVQVYLGAETTVRVPITGTIRNEWKYRCRRQNI